MNIQIIYKQYNYVTNKKYRNNYVNVEYQYTNNI